MQSEVKIQDALYDELGKELNFAWMKYDKCFGGPPRGTVAQLKALLCLTKIPERITRLIAEVKRLEDSRFELASVHTEDTLTIDRLTAQVTALEVKYAEVKQDFLEADSLRATFEDENAALKQRIADLVSQFAEARKAAEWVPVQERMPDSSKAVLVWCPERKNKYTACWKVPYWLHFGGACSSEVTEDVTHWKPLPPAPKESAKP